MLSRGPLLFIGLWCLSSLSVMLFSFDYQTIYLDRILQAPGWGAWLGYDELGRAIVDRLIVGAHTSFIIAVSVVVISFVGGTAIGIMSAWLGGWYDRIIVMLIDLFMAFPGLLLAIALAGLLGPGLSNAVIALTVVGWVGFARLARAQTLSVRERQHVQAAHALGSGTVYIASRHIFPLVLAPLIVQATFELAGTVIAESTLSFLGIGVQAPAASWGSMIRDGMRYMLIAPHVVMAPGAAIFLVVMSINMFGDRLRDKMDVHLNDQARGKTCH
ncbi:MAG: ABC transporter permease [Gammaproteobacteria bacterium]